jgi:hypothetical protein
MAKVGAIEAADRVTASTTVRVLLSIRNPPESPRISSYRKA